MKNFNFFIQYILFKILKGTLMIFPEKTRFKIAESLSILSYKLLKSRRITTLINLKHVFPDKSLSELEEIAKNSYKAIGKAFVGTLWLDKYVNKKGNFIVDDPKMVDVMKNNTPLTAANMHFGNMEGLLNS